MSDVDDLYAAVGYGGLTTTQVLNRLLEGFKKEAPAAMQQSNADAVNALQGDITKSAAQQRQHSKSGILINGNANFTVHMARCCSPVPGDEIIGYISRGRGVSVHRKDCPNVKGMEDERLIQASWDIGGDEYFEAALLITGFNNPGLLAAVTTQIAGMKIQITSANLKIDVKEHKAEINLSVQIKTSAELEDLLKKIKSLDSVIDIRRS
jgi:GTP pyrophosphokinase